MLNLYRDLKSNKISTIHQCNNNNIKKTKIALEKKDTKYILKHSFVVNTDPQEGEYWTGLLASCGNLYFKIGTNRWH